jgi:hypothetical protein
MTWNPNAPDTLGMEWAPTRAEIHPIGTEGAAFAVSWEAEVTRTLGQLGAALNVVTRGDWTVELYHEDDYLTAMTEAIQHASFDPTSDRHVHPGVWSYATDSAPYYRWVVGAPGTGTNANFMVILGPGKGYTDCFYAARYAGLAIPSTNRLLALRLRNDRHHANFGQDPNNLAWLEYGFADTSDGATRITSAERITTGAGQQVVDYTFRPRNVLATNNHSANLSLWTGSLSCFGFFYNSYAGTGMQMDIYHLQMTADYVPERRMAWGVGTPVPGFAALTAQTLTPNGAPQTLTAGERYVLLVRGANYSDAAPFAARLQALLGGPPITGYGSGRVKVDANGLPTEVPPTDSAGVPVWTLTSGTPDADTVPFAIQGVSPVVGVLPARQRITVPSAGSVNQAVVPIARANYPDASPLIMRLTDNAGAPLGGASILSTEAWDTLPNAYTMGARTVKNVRVDFAQSIALAPGDYWIEVTCPDVFPLDLGVEPWGVLYHEGFSPNITPDPGFEPDGDNGARNASVVLIEQPPALTDVVAAMEVERLNTATAACAGWWDTTVLTWDPTTLPAEDFVRYEIERQDPVSGSWERVAHIFDPTITTYRDREARRNRPVVYRLRVMRVDGGTAMWVGSAALTPRSYCCGLGLVTNYSERATSLFFPDILDERSYQNLDADALVVRPTYGRDYQLAFHPTERRGVVLNTSLLVHSGTATTGLPAFDALRELARADLPYVAVLDELGSRILAAIAAPELTIHPNRALQRYYSTFTATEITGIPDIYSVAAPPTPLPIAGVFTMGPHPNDRLDSEFFMGFDN